MKNILKNVLKILVVIGLIFGFISVERVSEYLVVFVVMIFKFIDELCLYVVKYWKVIFCLFFGDFGFEKGKGVVSVVVRGWE